MSLMDESFPHDDIFDNKFDACDEWNNVSDEKIQDDGKKILKEKISNTKTDKRLKKFQSYNDLHTKYTSVKYKHVPSKVRQYIDELEETENKKRSKLPRFHSLPINKEVDKKINSDGENKLSDKDLNKDHSDDHNENSLNSTTDELELTSLENLYKNHKFNIPTITNDENHNETDAILISTEIINKLYTEMQELRSMNKYLQTNLDNKVAQVAKLIRVNDEMQIDMVHLQDKLKNIQLHQHRFSLPESYMLWSHGKCNQSTQTDHVQQNECDIMMMLNGAKFNKIDDIQLNESFLYNLATAGNDSIFCGGGGDVLTTPELNKIRLSAKIDEDRLSVDSTNSNINQQNQQQQQQLQKQNSNQLDANLNQKNKSSKLRLRSNSNDKKKHIQSVKMNSIIQQPHISKNGSDSAIESENEIDEEHHMTTNSLEQFLNSNSQNTLSHKYKNSTQLNNNTKIKLNKYGVIKKQRKIKLIRKSIWKKLFGTCYICSKKKSRSRQDETIIYTQVNLSESTQCEDNSTNQ